MPEVIHAATTMPPDLIRSLVGQFPDGVQCRHVLVRDTDVFKPDGSLLLAFRKRGAPSAAWDRAYPAVRRSARKVDPFTGRRVAAGGQDNFRSGTIGYMRGRLTNTTRSDMRTWLATHPLVRAIDSVFRTECPVQYEAHRAAVCGVSYRCLISGTLFTTLTCNRTDAVAGVTARTACHPDRGNVPGAYGALSVAGRYTGGLLVFPKFRVAVDLQPLDVLIADNRELHGNTAIEGHRLSLVCYVHATNRERADATTPGGPRT